MKLSLGVEDTKFYIAVSRCWRFYNARGWLHLVSAVARDAAGNTVTQSVTVQVDNTLSRDRKLDTCKWYYTKSYRTDVAVTLSEAIRSTGFHFELRNASEP
ncbi:MAG: hypothetical protein R3C56_03615 [Pirellulaceae bacterium]